MTNEPTLPGLEPPAPAKSAIEEACDAWLSDLDAENGLTPLRRFLGEIIRSQTHVVAVGAGSAKTSAVKAIPNVLACIQAMKLDAGDQRKADQFQALISEMRGAR